MSIIEQRARALKASKLVEQLHLAGATASVIPFLDEDAWRAAAQAARVPVPSDRTRGLVASWFTERDQPASDPFAGLDDAPEAVL